MPFACSICEQESTRICAFCTKDACANHICVRCGCCSDCCECDVPLDEAAGDQVFVHTEPAPPPGVETPHEMFEPAGLDTDAGVGPSEFRTPKVEPWPTAENQSTTEESVSEPFDTPEV